MALDLSQCEAVESVPGKLGGGWVFRGTRIHVSVVFENMDDGLTISEVIALYEGLTLENVHAVLDFACRSLGALTSARS
jgi:uncharacterized protein (DUF433 family)